MARRKGMKRSANRKPAVHKFDMNPPLTDAGQSSRAAGQGKGYEQFELLYNRSQRVSRNNSILDIPKYRYKWV